MAEIEGTYQPFLDIPATPVDSPIGLPLSVLTYLRDSTKHQLMLARKVVEEAARRVADTSGAKEMFQRHLVDAERRVKLSEAIAIVLSAVFNECERSAIEASVRPRPF